MRKSHLGLAVLVAMLCGLSSSAVGTTFYVDSSVSSSGNGQSWATAWRTFSNITGLQPGDTIYVSGGTTSQTYTLDSWMPSGGTSASPISYKVGQDAGHNGTVIFQGGNHWLGSGGTGTLQYITINGIGSDGTNHMTVQGYSDYVVYCESSTNCRHISIQHVNFPNMKAGFRFGNSAGVDLGYNKIYKVYWGSDGTHDDVIWACQESSSGAYDCLIHDNYISIPAWSGNSALGDDGIKWGSGISFYNNHVKVALTASYSSNQSTSQHADGFQINESHYKIYSNVFEDIGESNIYHDDFDTPRNISGIYIYNNLFVQSHVPGTNVPRGIDILPESGGIGTTFTDVVIANNEWVDASGYMYTVRFESIASCTNCRFQNNIDKDNVGTDIVGVPVTVSNNTASANWVSYNRYAVSTNDLHLASSDTVNINHGINLSTWFSADKDGNSRPQSSVWDIGAYESGSTAAISPPTGLSAVVQ
ncbi:MAG: Peptidase in kexin sedolisin [Acidobacteriaceae bacterium]|nr:Peptidase in kexin sedolisin [Acidobacteriaceae bacterium]